MAVEKAFAINGEAGEIWDALWNDLIAGDEGAYSVISSHRPESLALEVELGGIDCGLTYQIEPRDGFCEVAAILEPRGLRYSMYQFLTFGHLRRNYELVLVTALSNLKAAVEEGWGPAAEPDEVGPDHE